MPNKDLDEFIPASLDELLDVLIEIVAAGEEDETTKPEAKRQLLSLVLQALPGKREQPEGHTSTTDPEATVITDDLVVDEYEQGFHDGYNSALAEAEAKIRKALK